MSKKLRKPSLGSKSFWEMAALAMAGELASCRSCVEHFYFQSHQNSDAFLESCVAGRLLERVSLLDLYGDIGPRPRPTVRQRWYDEPIYISAPRFRRLHLAAARERLENTKRAVREALRLYHEVLGTNDDAIDAAYANAVIESMLRHSDIASERIDVYMSPIAELRLIQDGFRNIIRKEHSAAEREEIETMAAKQTADYVKGFFGQQVSQVSSSDRAGELQEFIEEFLASRHTLDEFWSPRFGAIPATYKFQLLPVISELVLRRFTTLAKTDSNKAAEFLSLIRTRIAEGIQSADSEYAVALSGFEQELMILTSGDHRVAA